MAQNMFLFWGSGSNPCWKAMIVLEEKGLSGYGNKKISFGDKEHKGEDVLALNPRGQVPAFKDGDEVVNESGAICFYLEKKYSGSGTQLLPADIQSYGKVVQRVFEVSNLENALMTQIVYYFMKTPKEQIDQEVLKTRYEAARTELRRWNTYLEQSKGFVVGDSFTMADVFFFPFIAWGVRAGLKLDAFPAIKTYYEKIKERPSIRASWPPHWVGSEGNTSWMDSI